MKNLLLILLLISILSACSEESVSEAPKENVEIKTEKKTFSKEEVFSKGKQIAQATGKHMKKNLMAAMKSGGVEKAVGFCNINASVITDSLSKHYNVDIKRTSPKLRSEKNRATKGENRVLDYYEKTFSEGKKLQASIEKETEFYAPITMEGACLRCHGTVGKEIKTKEYEIIKKLYPTDKAVNYKAGDFRGIWHLTFN